ncbi:MAG: ATP-binding protein [Gallionellaceae bacterium]|jgi:signal transduction histidine kinase
MNSSMPIQKRHTNKQGFPLRLFAAAFVISISITTLSGWLSWQMHNQAKEMARKHIALTEDVGRIMQYDEVLTMSARMAAATGDFNYENRYDEFDLKLTIEINEVRAILPQADIAHFVSETDDANNALVKMERQAFALTHQGKRQEATTLLASAEYLRLKKVYAGGMEKTVNAANELIERETRLLHSLSFLLAAASTVGVLVLLTAWFFAIRSARNWAAERREAEDALRKAQDELVRNEKLAVLGQVAGSVGHELRNPLGVMSNAVFFLQNVLTDADETTKEYLEIIKSEIEGSERIVSDLLDSVRTKQPHAEIVSVREVLEQTLRKLAIPSSVTVKQDIPATLSPLRVDALQIQQVLRNLISNGIEAIDGVGTLEIRALEDVPAKTITVSIKDSGSGMTPEQLGKLFQPLFTTKARGIGLGLVVVKNLTKANGGNVGVQSEVGKGSTFFVTLPSGSSDAGSL